MNIFAIDDDPSRCAEYMVDKHVVKMILETAQLLSTAHRVLDGVKTDALSKTGRKVSRWVLGDSRDDHLYSATHVNHPSAVWCRENINNYIWLYCHFLALLNEYTYRYGKHHKCEGMIDYLKGAPHNISHAPLTQVTPAMPDEYKVPYNSVESYRNYYKHSKTHLHKWTKRNPPEWLVA